MSKSYKECLIEELIAQHQAKEASKDILIVVHNQPELTRRCLESVYDHTKAPFNVCVWDNASDKETKEVLSSFAKSNNNFYHSTVSEENIGFILPNNVMAANTSSEYLILLNNDTEVQEGWDTGLIGYLQAYPKVKIVGYQGGLLSKDGIGINSHNGPDVDYVMGWCLCMERSFYEQNGLFDEKNLEFAYGEDSDLSLRVREQGHEVYALCMELVKHHAHQTTSAVKKKRDIKPWFVANHQYVQKRWGEYLASHRVLNRFPDVEEKILEAWKKQHGNDLCLESLVAACL